MTVLAAVTAVAAAMTITAVVRTVPTGVTTIAAVETITVVARAVQNALVATLIAGKIVKATATMIAATMVIAGAGASLGATGGVTGLATQRRPIAMAAIGTLRVAIAAIAAIMMLRVAMTAITMPRVATVVGLHLMPAGRMLASMRQWLRCRCRPIAAGGSVMAMPLLQWWSWWRRLPMAGLIAGAGAGNEARGRAFRALPRAYTIYLLSAQVHGNCDQGPAQMEAVVRSPLIRRPSNLPRLRTH